MAWGTIGFGEGQAVEEEISSGCLERFRFHHELVERKLIEHKRMFTPTSAILLNGWYIDGDSRRATACYTGVKKGKTESALERVEYVLKIYSTVFSYCPVALRSS